MNDEVRAPKRFPRRSLPLIGRLGTGSHQKCDYSCGDACHRPAPNVSDNPTFGDVVATMVSRRSVLKGGVATAFVIGGGRLLGTAAPASAEVLAPETAAPGAGAGVVEPRVETLQSRPDLTFPPVESSSGLDRVVVPDGYDNRWLIRWGDPILPDAPAYRFGRVTPESQAAAFGYNNDYLAFLPFVLDSQDSSHGFLVANHEYTNPLLMFRGYDPENPTLEQVRIELAAHGMSVVEVQRRAGTDRSFFYRRNSTYNRRITAETELLLSGPAAGSPLLQTSADPSGTRVLGTLNNCAGGMTPWGTVLSGEENFDQYFGGANLLPDDDPRKAVHTRYGLETEGDDATVAVPSARKWERFYDRFDVAKEPNEPFRFGWVLEVDPYDPDWVPRKRTALGRTKHEGAETTFTADGRIAVYMGDDQQFDYVYKFVTAGVYDPGNREAARNLLDEGTLYVARYNGDGLADGEFDGTGEWLPLVYGQGPLIERNGFTSQADVLVKTRIAADLLGATKMDRPEDIQASPVSGRVYLALTNNSNRAVLRPDGTANPGLDEANPRVANRAGHVIEMDEAANDAGATIFSWRIFLLCGDPSDPSTYFAGYDPSQVSPIGAPDNLAFDGAGNLWIATDGQPRAIGKNDAFHAVATAGAERGRVRQFLSVPNGAEACGPYFTPDDRTMFCAVQHPGEDGTLRMPTSDWPDGNGGAPRPSVVSIWKTAPGDPRIGS